MGRTSYCYTTDIIISHSAHVKYATCDKLYPRIPLQMKLLLYDPYKVVGPTILVLLDFSHYGPITCYADAATDDMRTINNYLLSSVQIESHLTLSDPAAHPPFIRNICN